MSDPAQDDNGFGGWTADFDSVVIPEPVNYSSISPTSSAQDKPSTETAAFVPSESSWPNSGVGKSTSRPQVGGISFSNNLDTIKDAQNTTVAASEETESIQALKLEKSDQVQEAKPNEIKCGLSLEEIGSIFRESFKSNYNLDDGISNSSSLSSLSCDSNINVNHNACPPSVQKPSDEEWTSLVNNLKTNLSNDLVWKNLQSMEGMQSIKIKKWILSHSFEQFLSALNIDPSQTARDDVPIFASGLGLLEPVKSCDNPVNSPPQTKLTPVSTSSAVPPLSSFSNPILKPTMPLGGPVNWPTNQNQTVNWDFQAEVSRCLSSSPDVRPMSNDHNVSLSIDPHAQYAMNLNPETLVVPVNPVGIKPGSNLYNCSISDCEKEGNHKYQSIKCEEQQHNPADIGGRFDRVLNSKIQPDSDCGHHNGDQNGKVPARSENQKSDHCSSSDRIPFHEPSPRHNDHHHRRNDSLPILAFLSDHLPNAFCENEKD